MFIFINTKWTWKRKNRVFCATIPSSHFIWRTQFQFLDSNFDAIALLNLMPQNANKHSQDGSFWSALSPSSQRPPCHWSLAKNLLLLSICARHCKKVLKSLMRCNSFQARREKLENLNNLRSQVFISGEEPFQTSQELRMLSRSLSDFKSLLLKFRNFSV